MRNDHAYNMQEIKGAFLNGVVLILTETLSVFLFLYCASGLYTWMWGEIPEASFLEIGIAVIVIDFLYYWYHRVHHNNKYLYKIHRIHHVGRYYNLSLAIMLPWLGQASIYCMLIFFVFISLTPKAILSGYFFILTYQFFTHMKYLKMHKWFDVVFITPRTHKIHHYEDRESQMSNYGSFLSLWDKIFFTYSKREKDIDANKEGYTYQDVIRMEKESFLQFFK